MWKDVPTSCASSLLFRAKGKPNAMCFEGYSAAAVVRPAFWAAHIFRFEATELNDDARALERANVHLMAERHIRLRRFQMLGKRRKVVDVLKLSAAADYVEI
jgi:hypothetical protein